VDALGLDLGPLISNYRSVKRGYLAHCGHWLGR